MSKKVELEKGKREFKTFSNQHRLPRLPIPSLEESTTRYLNSLRPLLSSEELARIKQHVKDFIRPGGIGQILQQRLIDVDRISPYNWLDDAWWMKKAYHEWRVPLVVNSNWYIAFIDDPNTPKEYLTHNNGVRPKGQFSEWQIKRAAHIIGRMLDFKELIDTETLPPDVTRSYPLCMYQYTRCYGVTRIPKPGSDELVYTPHPAPARYILVIAKNQFYVLDGYGKNGQRYSDGDFEIQLRQIVDDVLKAKHDPPVGVLTADDRDFWAVARENLLKVSPQNRETLTFIENALFAISLDDYSTGVDLDKFIRNMFHGMNAHNRWFDKALSISIESSGRGALNGEHSPCDALIPSIIVDWVMSESTTLNAPTSGRLTAAPRRIRFVTDEQTLKDIAEAEKRIGPIIADSDAVILQFSEYGTHFIKKIAKCSPDAYMQMVIQLAYFKTHKKVVPTYETGSTRQFLHGRTGTIRTLSVESKSFVEGMESESLTAQEKYNLLQAATKAHSDYTRDVSDGKGCDRHLLGLRLLLREGESHPFFTEPIFAKSQEWLLSTSGLGAGNRLSGSGFGCVFPNGYGINYLTGDNLLKFGIESKYSSTETDSNALRQNIVNALKEMRDICEQVNGIYEKESRL
ncbi:acyltransferase ChoActase/COT/CPT [Rhizophagus irregularis]|uniref:Acyltransferase ChoActase/COT/CPT n=1 Tax=Rhizophagus irregularis TaxID=588596 RepID=A0A2I1G1I1_9GLOM|nr:acyltransferase ChoActase/COT/CPT [Rhizophagus irregularis]